MYIVRDGKLEKHTGTLHSAWSQEAVALQERILAFPPVLEVPGESREEVKVNELIASHYETSLK